MAIAVASTASNSATSSTTVVITKPTGLAVGDLMVSVLSVQGGSVTINTLSGWTSADSESYTQGVTKVQYKVADSGDVAASDFTFTSDFSANLFGGTIMRVTGATPSSIVDVSDSQNYNSTATATINFSTSLAIANDGSLIVMGFAGQQNGSGTGTMASYVASDGTLSWTELHDYSVDASTVDPIFGGAYAIQGTKTTLTSYGATLSGSREVHGGVIVVFKAIINASGTAALHTASPTFFAGTASVGASGTAALHAASPTFFDPIGEAVQPQIWTPVTKS